MITVAASTATTQYSPASLTEAANPRTNPSAHRGRRSAGGATSRTAAVTTAATKAVSANGSVARNQSMGDVASAPATRGAAHREAPGPVIPSANPQAASEHATHNATMIALAPRPPANPIPHASNSTYAWGQRGTDNQGVVWIAPVSRTRCGITR